MYNKMTYINASKKVVKTIINLILIVLFNVIATAQQVPHYTQYLYNMEVLNPAFVGAKSDLSISLLSRQQWSGVDGAPETHTFSINGRLKDGLGFGTTVVNDQIGLAKTTNINVDASYTIPTSQHGRLSFGIKGGYTFFTNDLLSGVTSDGDVYASTNNEFANIGFGGLYYNDKFFVGVSIPNLLKSTTFLLEQTASTSEAISIDNYFVVGGAIINVTDNILFKPSTLIKYSPNLPLSVDVNANVIFKDKFETGLSYRYKSAISAVFALHVSKMMRVGYSYDYNLTNLAGNLSSHEIILRFDFKLKRKSRWLFHNACYF